MKKNNLILIFIITLLVLFSSNNISNAAVTREEFQKEIVKSAKTMIGGNARFVAVSDNDDYKHNLTFNDGKARSFYSPEKGNTVLAFNEETFVTYVYKEVLGLKMKDGSGPYNGYDIYHCGYNNKNDTTCRWFYTPFGSGDWKAKSLVNGDGGRHLQIGDILLEADVFLGGLNNVKLVWIYIGNDEFIGFKDGAVQVKTATALGNNTYDVFRITSSALNQSTLGSVDLSDDGVIWDATTISDALANLHIKKVTVEGSDAEVKFVDENDKAVTPKAIVAAIKEGAISQFGDAAKVKKIYFTLDYNDEYNMKQPMGSNINGQSSTKIKIELTTSESSTKNKKFGNKDYLDLKKYETDFFGYWGYEYISQKDHSLYLGIYVTLDGTTGWKNVASYSIANGVEHEVGGKKTIDCFPSIVEKYTGTYFPALQGQKPTLQDFLDFKFELPDYTYELVFTGTPSQNIGGATPTPYKTNSKGEIVFTVNKSGRYRITPELYNGTGDNIKAEYVYICRGENKKNQYTGKNDIVTSDIMIPIKLAGFQPSGTSDVCIDADCANLNQPVGNYYQIDPYLTYPLKAGIPYVINIKPTVNKMGLMSYGYSVNNWIFRVDYLDNNLVELLDHGGGDVARISQNISQYHYGGTENYNIFQRLEFMVSSWVRGMANGVVLMMNAALGYVESDTGNQTVSIDSIVFDNYPVTRLDFFEKDLTVDGQSSFIQRFTSSINTWYSNFMLIAIVAYLGVLLYMGIRIVLNSTAAKQAMFKEVFMQWVTGVVILFMFPIVIRYAIKINRSFVNIVEEYVVKENSGSKIDSSESDTEYIAPSLDSEIADGDKTTKEAQQMGENPFKDTDNGYMAIMARRAHLTKRLSFAVVYFIMTIQLVIIAVMYYKRLFMVGFLIVLFPVVMVAHILEKVADIKIGGAFGKWTKEILITIFVQSIHAVVYSFAIGTVMAASDASNDWILMLVGVTFLFNGEEILKKILGQTSESVKSLKETAAKTVATAAIVKKGASMIADNVVGAGSHLGQMMAHRREAKTHNKKAKLVSVMGEKPKEYKLPPAERLEHYKPEYTEFSDTKAKTLGTAIQVLNHRDYAKPEDIAKAIDTVGKYKDSGEYPELLQDLNMTDEQFEGLRSARDHVEQSVVNGKGTKEEIDMRLTMELERIFPQNDTDLMKLAIYSQVGKALPGSTRNKVDASQEAVKSEIDTARQNYQNLRDRILIGRDKDPKKKIEDPEADKKAVRLLQDIYGQQKHYTNDQMAMAINVVTLQEAGKRAANGVGGKYDALELMTAANFVYENQANNKEFAKMAARVGCDIGDFRHVLAEKISEEGYGVNYREDGRENRKLNPNASPRLKAAIKEADKVLDEFEVQTNDAKESGTKSIGVAEIMAHDAEVARANGESEKRALEENFENEMMLAKQKWNDEAQQALNEFSKEMSEKISKRRNERKIDGLTAEEHKAIATAHYKEARKEGFAAVKTTEAVAIGAVLGSVGGAKGMGAGMVVADSVAEFAVGGRNKKVIEKVNPYTGDVEKIEVTARGAFSNKFAAKLDDSKLTSKMSSKIDRQFIEHAAAKAQNVEKQKEERLRNAQEAERLKRAADRALNGDNTNT